jgi:drug/metabolite transporter (DMT)-like permease
VTSRFTSSKGSWVPGFIALGIVWGSSFLFIKWGLLSLTSIGVAFLRGLIGGLTLLLFALATRTRLPNKLIHWFHLAVVALFLNAIPSYLFAVGETHVTSVMAGLLNATTPLMTVIVITFAFREQKINRDQGIGVLIGFIGIAILTGAISGLHGSDLKGIAALLLATFCYGISMPYSKRFVAPLPYSSTALAAGQVIASATLLAPFAMLGGLTHAPWNGKSITGMLALGAMGTGFAYIWSYRNVRLAGSAVASTVTYITPIVATVLGIWLLKEPFKISQLFGAALVLLSAALVQKKISLSKKNS